jgi:prevent-host-death family protein
MAKTYSLAEAKAQLPAIVDQAERGQNIQLTRRGKPVVVMMSFEEFERLKRNRPPFRETYHTFLRKFSTAKVGVEKGFTAPLRDRGRGRRVAL